MSKPRSFFSRGRRVQTVDRILKDLRERGVIRQRAGSGDGATWDVDGKEFYNFGTCSYMGLGSHPDLIAGAEDALHKYGTNFSISRIYLECPLYGELEEALGEVMGRPVLVAPSTTYCHLGALPVMVGDKDLVIVDQFAHASIHMAIELIDDVPVELLRHSRIDVLEQRLKEVGDQYERIWYLCDGVYSMLGDLAPYEELKGLLDRYPRLYLYIDDAHAMSWMGPRGMGGALEAFGDSDRVTVSVSLSKAFGATGGALAFTNEEMRDMVQLCGGPMIFSGPMPPPALGAAVASAKLHLSPEYPEMQRELYDRMNLMASSIKEHGLVTATDTITPIFMIHYDSAADASAVVNGLRDKGFYCCPSTFPAVPMNKPSIRFTVGRHNPMEDVSAMVEALAEVSAAVEPESVLHGAHARAAV